MSIVRPFAFLLLGLGVLVAAVTVSQIAAFLLLLALGLLVMYSLLLAFAGMVFLSPGFLFGWVFDGLFQMARFPVTLYPGWIRLALTWIIPVAIMTTLPAQALTGEVAAEMVIGGMLLGLLLFVGATVLFRTGLRRYASASS
ncbi:MAG: ABC-2 family transporter protein [Anaerolineae bacterium]|nr:ABC-2 family transporter protein [Anaerolineae bacterium]